MRKSSKIVAIVMVVLMSLATAISFFKDSKLLFTHESADYLSSISDVNHLTSVLFLFFFLITLIFIKYGLKKNLLLLSFFILWLMSGRVVAFKSFPDGRIITGWYYIEGNSFKLCNQNIDCERMLFKETKVKRLPLWRISIDNNLSNKKIFIGPFTWNSSAKVFEEHIGR